MFSVYINNVEINVALHHNAAHGFRLRLDLFFLGGRERAVSDLMAII